MKRKMNFIKRLYGLSFYLFVGAAISCFIGIWAPICIEVGVPIGITTGAIILSMLLLREFDLWFFKKFPGSWFFISRQGEQPSIVTDGKLFLEEESDKAVSTGRQWRFVPKDIWFTSYVGSIDLIVNRQEIHCKEGGLPKQLVLQFETATRTDSGLVPALVITQLTFSTVPEDLFKLYNYLSDREVNLNEKLEGEVSSHLLEKCFGVLSTSLGETFNRATETSMKTHFQTTLSPEERAFLEITRVQIIKSAPVNENNAVFAALEKKRIAEVEKERLLIEATGAAERKNVEAAAEKQARIEKLEATIKENSEIIRVSMEQATIEANKQKAINKSHTKASALAAQDIKTLGQAAMALFDLDK